MLLTLLLLLWWLLIEAIMFLYKSSKWLVTLAMGAGVGVELPPQL